MSVITKHKIQLQMKSVVSFYFSIFLLLPCKDASAKNYTYKAAVVEYSPIFNYSDKATEVFKKNVPNFINYIKQAANKNVDIIVFPEDGLTGVMNEAFVNRKSILPFGTDVPDPKNKISPCNSTKYGQHLRNISCAAAENKIYVVINLIELLNCTAQRNCPEDIFIYNTNVVFDRTGVVIAKYRKYNLYLEPGFDVTDEAELITFDTDFGVTFGIFICYDIIFKKPPIELVRKKNVHHFVYSAVWHSELPFETALQNQMGWAYSNNVTLLASGYNDPKETRGGSGIFFGQYGALTQTFPLTKINQMLIANVPNHYYDESQRLQNENFNLDEITLHREDLRNYTTDIITQGYFAKKLCNNKLCCQFEVESLNINASYYVYRAVVYEGIRIDPGASQTGAKTCGVVNCVNETIDSCGIRNRTRETGILFKNIRIRGNFQQTENSFQKPSTLKSNLLPYNPQFFNYIISKCGIEMRLIKEVDDLLTFGIVGRNFTLDRRLD